MAMARQLTDFKALTFDCYGTLIDWETGMVEALEPLTSRVAKTLSRDEILEAHGREEARQQLFTPTKPYSELLAVVYKRLAEHWGVPATLDDCEAYGGSVGAWPAFADSAEALAYLKQHFRLIILSNVDNRSFSLSNRKLGVTFDAVYTAADIGSYKPAPRNFEYMLDHIGDLGLARGAILHTAQSLFHDHIPATELGLATCWIDRRRGEGFGATAKPKTLPKTDFRFDSMADLVAAHRRAVAGG
jgi:2-haloalkanoic acid dehalogenase type II